MILRRCLNHCYEPQERGLVYPDEITRSIIDFIRQHHPETVDESPGKMGIGEWEIWDIPSINARLDLQVMITEPNNSRNVIFARLHYLEGTSEEDLKQFRKALETKNFKNIGPI